MWLLEKNLNTLLEKNLNTFYFHWPALLYCCNLNVGSVTRQSGCHISCVGVQQTREPGNGVSRGQNSFCTLPAKPEHKPFPKLHTVAHRHSMQCCLELAWLWARYYPFLFYIYKLGRPYGSAKIKRDTLRQRPGSASNSKSNKYLLLTYKSPILDLLQKVFRNILIYDTGYFSQFFGSCDQKPWEEQLRSWLWLTVQSMVGQLFSSGLKDRQNIMAEGSTRGNSRGKQLSM